MSYMSITQLMSFFKEIFILFLFIYVEIPFFFKTFLVTLQPWCSIQKILCYKELTKDRPSTRSITFPPHFIHNRNLAKFG
jgi:hypothetical protein